MLFILLFVAAAYLYLKELKRPYQKKIVIFGYMTIALIFGTYYLGSLLGQIFYSIRVFK